MNVSKLGNLYLRKSDQWKAVNWCHSKSRTSSVHPSQYYLVTLDQTHLVFISISTNQHKITSNTVMQPCGHLQKCWESPVIFW